MPGLVPWREVINGRYQQAEFAADLDLVHRGIGSHAYTDPIEFFRRTFITEGLKDLPRIALLRFNGLGGEPVIELGTNVGGGKPIPPFAIAHDQMARPAHNPVVEFLKHPHGLLPAVAMGQPTGQIHAANRTLACCLLGLSCSCLGGTRGLSLRR